MKNYEDDKTWKVEVLGWEHVVSLGSKVSAEWYTTNSLS